MRTLNLKKSNSSSRIGSKVALATSTIIRLIHLWSSGSRLSGLSTKIESCKKREEMRKLSRRCTSGLKQEDAWRRKFNARKSIWILPRISKSREVSLELIGSQRTSIQTLILALKTAQLMNLKLREERQPREQIKFKMMMKSSWEPNRWDLGRSPRLQSL